MSWVLSSERQPAKPGVYKVSLDKKENLFNAYSKWENGYWHLHATTQQQAANMFSASSQILDKDRYWWDNHQEQVEECKKALEPKIWMVKGAGATNVVHPNEEAAMAEAKRLASKCPGQRFYVLMATHKVEVLAPEPKVTEL